MGSFNLQFLYCVVIIALGYFLKTRGIIKEKDGEGLSRIIFNITLPTLIIVTFHDIKIETSLFLLILIGFLRICIGFFALFLFRKTKKHKGYAWDDGTGL